MPDTITVGSRAHAAIMIREPMPAEFKDKPGEAPDLRTVMLNGANHEDAVAGVGVTKGVDASLFHAWLDDQKRSGTKLASMMFEMSDDEAMGMPMQFGHEPCMEALGADGENTAKAAEGSTVKDEAPVKASDLKATTVIPAPLAGVPADQVPNDMTKPAKA